MTLAPYFFLSCASLPECGAADFFLDFEVSFTDDPCWHQCAIVAVNADLDRLHHVLDHFLGIAKHHHGLVHVEQVVIKTRITRRH